MNPELTPSQRLALRAASHWYVHLNNNKIDPDRDAKWQAWYQQHSDHQWAWQQVEHLRQQMGQLPKHLASRTLHESRVTRRQILKGLLLLVIAGSIPLWDTPPTGTEFRTARTIRRQTLSDGTRLVLNSETATDIRFNTTERRVVLNYGEIAIQTAQDPFRPFRVQTAEGILTALGTRFIVRQDDNDTHLAVLAHAVEVRLQSGQRQRFRAGQQVSFTGQHFSFPEPVTEGEDSWADGMLVFRDASLDSVLATLARYRPGIVHYDPSVAHLRLSGTFPLHDTDAMLDVISQTLPVKIRSITRYWITVLPS